MGKAAGALGALGQIIPAVGGLFGGGGQKATETTTRGLSPQQQAAQDRLLASSQRFTDQPFQQFQGPRTQQFGPGFDQAAQNLGQVDPRIAQALQSGVGGLGMGSEFFQNFIGGQGPGGPQFNAEGIAQFTNPFQQQNIDATRAGFGRALESGLNTVGDQFTSQGAFGGSRQGIAEGTFAGNLARQEEEAVTGIRTRGFEDAARRLAGEQGRFDQFQGQQLGAAGNLANLGFGSTQALQQALQQAGLSGLNVGQQRQQLGQFDIGQQRERFGEQRQFDTQNVGLLQSLLSGLPNQGTVTDTGQRTDDPFQSAGGIADILGSLFGGGGGFQNPAPGLGQQISRQQPLTPPVPQLPPSQFPGFGAPVAPRLI